MRRLAASLAALLVAAALGLSSAAGSRATVLGFEWAVGGGTRLARYDALTLRRVGTGARLGVVGWPWRMSPDGVHLALSSDAPRAPVLVVDVVRLRREALIWPGVANPVAIFWPRVDRILVVGLNREVSEAHLALVDPGSGRVMGRVRLVGQLVAGDATGNGVALLFGPRVGIGRAPLVLVDADLRTRSVALPRTRAGWVRPKPRPTPDDRQPRVRAPGVAVDRAGGRAWVVAQDQPLAGIDLRSGTVTYRPLRIRRPAAVAKTLLGSTARVARRWTARGHGPRP
jgi:hypothetical protein